MPPRAADHKRPSRWLAAAVRLREPVEQLGVGRRDELEDEVAGVPATEPRRFLEQRAFREHGGGVRRRRRC